ncbi:helix-turn-helix transcriptional regulator [Nocardioides sp.]|uniref:helix-turn-helix transcriptional regulator n=1 Tax=Nocardioides sp. TaxID=35761 RepID=UPI0039E70B13
MAQTSRTLIGRDAELEELTSLLGIAAPGLSDGGHVLLSGDAGVGKTRLLQELRSRAAASQWEVYVGHCLDFGDSAVPYLPFTEIVDGIVDRFPDVVERVASVYPVLARLQPVRRLLGAAAEEGVLERSQLFEAAHALLDAASEEAPMLLVVEDTHWADQSTRDLLTFLFTRPHARPVRIVASYRADDLHRRHPLRRQVAEWARLRDVSRQALEPLPDDDVRALVTELDPAADETRVRDVIARADGNAFYVEELVAVGDSPNDWLPDELAGVLLVRLDRLDDGSRELVRTASAAGRTVSHDLLAAVAEVTGTALDEALRGAVEANVLVAGSGDYWFRHALLGEAVYDDLLPGERVRLHGRYAAALADEAVSRRTAAGDRAVQAQLARHARLAGDTATAIAASIRAGDEAAAVGGPDEAAQHYQQALSLLSAAGRPDDDDLIALVVKASDALIAAGQAARAGKLARQQLDRIGSDGPGLWRAQLLALIVEASFAYVDGNDMLPLAEQAVALLPPDAPPAVRARVLAVHARCLLIAERAEEAMGFAREALELAEGLGRAELAADLAVTLAKGSERMPCQERVARLSAAATRAEQAGALQAELRARMMLGITHIQYWDLAAAADAFRAGHERALAMGVPWAPYAFDCRVQLVWVHYVRGEWDEALSLADAVGAPAVLAAWLDSLRLTIEQARGAEVDPAVLRPYWSQEVATAFYGAQLEMTAAARHGDADGIAASYAAAAATIKVAYGEGFGARVRLAAVAVGRLAGLIARQNAGERATSLARVEHWLDDGRRAIAHQTARDPGDWGAEGRGWGLRLEAEALRARWLAGREVPADELVTAWRAAEAAFAEMADVPDLAEIRVILAGILRATGDATGAREVADLAREAARALGARPLLDELRTPAASARADTLTPRETEILALVAEGRSNGEIGKRLYISTKTVSVHVSNILAKLGAAGRTEAAAIARRRGLL